MIGHTEPVNIICFSPDGTRIASSSYDETVRLWDAQTGTAIGNPMYGHAWPVDTIDFSPDGIHLTTTSRHETLSWDLRSMTICIRPMTPCVSGDVPSIVHAFIDNEGWLVVGYYRTLYIPVQFHGEPIQAVRMVGGKTVCIGGETGTVVILWFPDK